VAVGEVNLTNGHVEAVFSGGAFTNSQITLELVKYVTDFGPPHHVLEDRDQFVGRQNVLHVEAEAFEKVAVALLAHQD